MEIVMFLIGLNLAILAYKQVDSILEKWRVRKAASQLGEKLLMEIKGNKTGTEEIKRAADKRENRKQD